LGENLGAFDVEDHRFPGTHASDEIAPEQHQQLIPQHGLTLFVDRANAIAVEKDLLVVKVAVKELAGKCIECLGRRNIERLEEIALTSDAFDDPGFMAAGGARRYELLEQSK
jgi:hypothetical protein